MYGSIPCLILPFSFMLNTVVFIVCSPHTQLRLGNHKTKTIVYYVMKYKHRCINLLTLIENIVT